jgi:hypothetical protein
MKEGSIVDHDRFDDLTRKLASGMSRRQALKLLGGGLLGALVPGSALAKGGNSACAKFCTSAFPPGPDRGKCISDAAKGKGRCYQCGPKSDGSKRLCGTTCFGPTEPCNGTCPTGSELCNDASSPNDQHCCITPIDASYGLTCFNIRLTYDAGKTILSADCENVSGDDRFPTSIIVDTCSSSNYAIVNCNAHLTCGSC